MELVWFIDVRKLPLLRHTYLCGLEVGGKYSLLFVGKTVKIWKRKNLDLSWKMQKSFPGGDNQLFLKKSYFSRHKFSPFSERFVSVIKNIHFHYKSLCFG